MKHLTFRKLITITCLSICLNTSAYEYYIDGIYYNRDYRYGEHSLEVTYMDSNNNGNAYSGEVNIPGYIEYRGSWFYVSSIGNDAFSNCKNLTHITIPENIDLIKNNSFRGCHELVSISIDSNNETYYSNGNSIIEKATKKLIVGCKNTIIPSNTLSIGSYAFNDCDKLTNIIIPNSVTSIGVCAFNDCDSLGSITIPASVTSIGGGTFGGCSNLKSIVVDRNNPVYDSRDNCNAIIETATNKLIAVCKSTTIPNSVPTIGSYAITGFNIESFSIPNGIKTIEDNALPYNLKTLTISATVQTIGYNSATKTIWLPNTPPTGYQQVSSKRHYVSNDSYTALKNSTIYPYLSSLFEVDGIKYVPVSPSERICDAIDCAYDSTATSINIGNEVSYRGISMTLKKIQPYICYDNDFIRNINIDFNDTIPCYAFYNCNSVTKTKVYTPLVIDKYAFQGCSRIEAVEIDATEINEQAFYLCSSITETTINASQIKKYAFQNCSSKNPATYEINANIIEEGAFRNCSAIEFAKITSDSIGNTAFMNSATKTNATFSCISKYIGDETFVGCSMLEQISLCDELVHIGDSSFYNCEKLLQIKIPNSVTTLGSYSFAGCTSLTDVNIGNSILHIKDYTFADCKILPTITIPNNVISIGNYAFSGCKSLADVTITESKSFLSLGSNGADPLFGDCPLKSIYIGRDITYNTSSEYGYSPFYNNTTLETVIISGLETEISYNEFYNCSNLKNMTIGNRVTTIGKQGFAKCSSLQSIVIPESVELINESAFSDCSSLKEIIVPYSVNSIGDYVFGGCSSLTYVSFADRETELSLGSNGSSPLFVDCPLKSVYIGGNITYPTSSSKGYSPFYRNLSLETVTITDKETEISKNEFYGCSALKNISMGDGVESIGNWAFSGCSSLDYFEFGSGMKTIGEEAFSDCTAMTKLISHSTIPPTCGTQALDDINKWLCELYIPEESMSAYQSADQWKEFFFVTTNIEKLDSSDVLLQEVARYDIHGRLLSEPTQGINIVIYSDGTTRKEFVK